MLRQRTTWKEAAWVFLLSRLALIIITWVSTMRFPLSGYKDAQNCVENLNPCLFAWFHWDAISYVNVATRGYSQIRDTAFFPLYPLLIHIVGWLFGGSASAYYFAGLLVANASFYLALVFLYALACDLFDAGIARNALFYLAFYPYAAFFFAGYTESLFLLLSLATLYFLRGHTTVDYWLAGASGFLAALTRATGVMLVVPFLVLVFLRLWAGERAIALFHKTIRLSALLAAPSGNTAQDKGENGAVVEATKLSRLQKMQRTLPLLLIPAAIAVYMVYLGIVKGDPLAFSTQEAVSWHRYFVFPWVAIIATAHNLLTTPYLHILNLVDFVFTLVPIIVLAFGWRHLPLHYNLFAVVMVLFSLCYPQGMVEPLTAVPRYMMVIFPIFLVLAFWSKKYPRFDRLYIACALPLFAINAVLFIGHYWVA